LETLRKLLKRQGIHPETLATDGLAPYRSAMRQLGMKARHRPGGMRANNRAENRHLPIRRRERKQLKFNSQGSAQRFLACHAAFPET
jgi:putative transposase